MTPASHRSGRGGNRVESGRASARPALSGAVYAALDAVLGKEASMPEGQDRLVEEFRSVLRERGFDVDALEGSSLPSRPPKYDGTTDALPETARPEARLTNDAAEPRVDREALSRLLDEWYVARHSQDETRKRETFDAILAALGGHKDG
jgi:hypothetical protein